MRLKKKTITKSDCRLLTYYAFDKPLPELSSAERKGRGSAKQSEKGAGK